MIWIPLVIIGIAVFVFVLIAKRGGVNSEQKITPALMGNSAAKLDIRRKDYFFTTTENAFYRQLLGVLHGRPYAVLSKVRLLDLFVPIKGENYLISKNKTAQKHVDFVILAMPSGKVLVALELDGNSHHSERQQAKDSEKDAIFQLAGLPLIRCKPSEKPDLVALKSLIEPYLELIKKPVNA